MTNLNISIAVCGSASAQLPQTFETKAWSIGKAIAEQGATLFTGATAGFPLAAVRGCNSVGGRSVGIAPGESAEDQFNRFEKIDLNLLSHVIFTGVGYKMRDIVMIRSVDAIIAIGGGVGTLVEISTAIDIRKPIGILQGSGGASELYEQINEISHRNKGVFIIDKNPEKLVKKLISYLSEQNKK